MTDLIIYILKSLIALGLFALAYKLIFQQEVNFKARRFYLLNAIMLAFILPLFTYNFKFLDSFQSNTLGSFVLDEITVYNNGFTSIQESTRIPFSEIIFYIYIAVAGILALKMIYQLFIIILKTKRYRGNHIDKLLIYRLPFDNVSFSFFNFIFIGKTPGNGDLDKILAHEKIHARQFHTLDVMIMEILTIIFWFNPLVWWYRNEIKNVHEYLADAGALNEGIHIKSYQITLLEHLIGSASLSITNNFNYSLIKNRIAMMNKAKNGRKNNWKIFLLLPVSILLIIGFACTEKDEMDENESLNNPETFTSDDKKSVDKEIFFIVEDMPKFNGGDPASEFRKYISENLKYPEIAKENNIEGKVILQFSVNSKGEVVDAKVVRGADPALDKEAIRVVMSSPDWTPGMQDGKAVKVQFTFPINFTLQ